MNNVKVLHAHREAVRDLAYPPQPPLTLIVLEMLTLDFVRRIPNS
jgi:hypothetical protein